MLTAHANVTITWNTRPAIHIAAASTPAPQTAILRAVHGTHVLVRLPDGTTHAFIASPQQAKLLEPLVGSAIQYRLERSGRL